MTSMPCIIPSFPCSDAGRCERRGRVVQIGDDLGSARQEAAARDPQGSFRRLGDLDPAIPRLDMPRQLPEACLGWRELGRRAGSHHAHTKSSYYTAVNAFTSCEITLVGA